MVAVVSVSALLNYSVLLEYGEVMFECQVCRKAFYGLGIGS